MPRAGLLLLPAVMLHSRLCFWTFGRSVHAALGPDPAPVFARNPCRLLHRGVDQEWRTPVGERGSLAKPLWGPVHGLGHEGRDPGLARAAELWYHWVSRCDPPVVISILLVPLMLRLHPRTRRARRDEGQNFLQGQGPGPSNDARLRPRALSIAGNR